MQNCQLTPIPLISLATIGDRRIANSPRQSATISDCQQQKSKDCFPSDVVKLGTSTDEIPTEPATVGDNRQQSVIIPQSSAKSATVSHDRQHFDRISDNWKLITTTILVDELSTELVKVVDEVSTELVTVGK
uniref:Uncharacterized protein n=1 Tax=Romanomermis culicivorax TaxID=13658 RepID=A0A915KIQ1_ROMCU